MFRRPSLLSFLVGVAFLATPGCTCNPARQDQVSSAATGQESRNPLVDRGRAIYNTNCIACHNSDPKKPGNVGPEVWGASLELLEARVLRAGYPDGYKPKRSSTAMPALPYLKGDIPALHAFLNQAP